MSWAWSPELQSNFGIRYRYDGEGTRVQRAEGPVASDLVYASSGRLLGEYDPSGGFREYVYLGPQLCAKITDETTVVATSP